MDVTWRCGSLTSSLYAVGKVLAGVPLSDGRVSAGLAGPASVLERVAEELNHAPALLLEHLIPFSAGADDLRWLARAALSKLQSEVGEAQVDALSRALFEVHRISQSLWPNVADDLLLRAEPLRGQWEARGPGMLYLCGKLAESLLVESAEILVVLPVAGGGGMACPLMNRVVIEGVLTNPCPQLPEVVRLAWLLLQLNLELPKNSEPLGVSQALSMGSLATVPLALWAAQNVELGECTLASLEQALAQWGLKTSSVGVLWEWWGTFLDRVPPWNIALAGLAEMLSQQS